MRYLLLTLSIVSIFLGAVSCTSTVQPQSIMELASVTPIPSSTLTITPTHLPPTPQASRTPTPTTPKFDVIEIVPSHRCGIDVDKRIFTASWKNDSAFVFAYYPISQTEPDLFNGDVPTKVELQWVSRNIETEDETPDTPFINYDETFWDRNHINTNAVDPELAGFFSPSGKYVIYSIFLGVSFEPSAKNQIWVAEVYGKQRWKIDEFSGNGVNIYRAAWFDGETKVIFNTAYEGPSEFYVSDFKLHKTVRLSEVSKFSGITESTWRLSPDGKTLAVVDAGGQLLLVSLGTGELQIVETYGGNFPQWSNDGKFLFYWWRADKNNWQGSIDELKIYNVDSGNKSTLIDKANLTAGFQDYQGDDNCISHDYYLQGGRYAVSPNQKSILLWDNGLYLLTKK